jgi:hypothetical protein
MALFEPPAFQELEAMVEDEDDLYYSPTEHKAYIFINSNYENAR